MVRALFVSFVVLIPALTLRGDDRWIDYRSGPLHLITDAGDRIGRERLTQLEQLRWTLGGLLGKRDLQTAWPVHVVLFRNQKEYPRYALAHAFETGRDAILSCWMAERPLPQDWMRALVLLLVESNTPRFPQGTEGGLASLFSTLDVHGTRVTVGAPPAPELRTKDWARMHFLVTSQDYGGRVRVMISNLEQGADMNTACHNAFEKGSAEMERLVDAYFQAGRFGTAALSGEALNPNKDYVEVPLDPAAARLELADLLAANPAHTEEAKAAYAALAGPGAQEGLGLIALAGKQTGEARKHLDAAVQADTRSARAWLEDGSLQTGRTKKWAAIQKAARLNPRWAEPHVRMAAMETDDALKARDLKAAATLEPRNPALWKAAAIALMDAHQYQEAAKAWGAAERASSSQAERAQIRRDRLDVERQRADYEAAEKKRIAEEHAREIERLKQQAAAEVHAAEEAANRRLSAGKAPVDQSRAVPWWQDPTGDHSLSGMLERVDCLGGPARLLIRGEDHKLVQVLVRDPGQVVVRGSRKTFACGVQRPPLKVNLQYNARTDAKFKTAGDVVVVEFP